ncbi:NmrA family NAD(P)-binding protein [Allostreptomyces psammosilenae]|uniref:Uncharacterized protein YbjT (DUF2867 family) n=1 Tax=Allostreptomyces psammosilenae TaxID=1892865 RepID=A0A853AB54_9ACTN|nr:NmrA family NAD(P)-binding protein [Allostreptomyces psammosilenae]NYI07841.1 uncharacterized protein YbjT (DUF2867 family) [Allostreptomyces psammosilenae]
MTYLVTGGSGKAGRHVVRELLRAGQRVRVLTRDPARARLPAGVEAVAGDLTDPSTLGPALAGVVGVHLIVNAGDDYAVLQTGPEIVELAEKAGVRRVSVLWDGRIGPVEKAVEDSALEWTQIHPVDFMGNALTWADDIRSAGVVREPFGDVAVAIVDEADVGAVAATALVEDGHAGRTYLLTGPELLSQRQRLAVIGAAIGRSLRFEELSEEQARARWRAAGVEESMVDLLAEWQGNPPPEARAVSPAVEEITGRPARTFAQWAAEHAESFR